MCVSTPFSSGTSFRHYLDSTLSVLHVCVCKYLYVCVCVYKKTQKHICTITLEST